MNLLNYKDIVKFNGKSNTYINPESRFLCKHGDTYLPKDDTHFKRWFSNGTILYQRAQLVKAIQNVDNKGLFLDIGGHAGLMTRQALELGFERFIAFEPNHVNATCFSMNVKGNGELHVKGVSSKKETVTINQKDPTNSGTNVSRKIDNRYKGSREDTLEVDSLDNMLGVDVRVDLLKIDVEGFELEVIKGAEGLINNSKPVILLEQSDTSGFPALKYLEEHHGMTVVGSVNKDYILKF